MFLDSAQQCLSMLPVESNNCYYMRNHSLTLENYPNGEEKTQAIVPNTPF
jgi:hypothetical protein